MIKATELRIGNWVSIGGNQTTIAHIMGDEDYFEPILLTPEILEACGLIDGELEIKLNDLYAGLNIVEGKLYLTDFETNTIGIEIKYLHQLQNLIFALTGEELTVKELSHQTT